MLQTNVTSKLVVIGRRLRICNTAFNSKMALRVAPGGPGTERKLF